MEMHVRLGATKDGIVKGIDLYTLSNTGAYGEHGPTTVGLSGHKSIPLYGKADARACLRWNLLSTSWLPDFTWTPSRSVK